MDVSTRTGQFGMLLRVAVGCSLWRDFWCGRLSVWMLLAARSRLRSRRDPSCSTHWARFVGNHQRLA
jgi:hypothetical protein